MCGHGWHHNELAFAQTCHTAAHSVAVFQTNSDGRNCRRNLAGYPAAQTSWRAPNRAARPCKRLVPAAGRARACAARRARFQPGRKASASGTAGPGFQGCDRPGKRARNSSKQNSSGMPFRPQGFGALEGSRISAVLIELALAAMPKPATPSGSPRNSALPRSR